MNRRRGTALSILLLGVLICGAWSTVWAVGITVTLRSSTVPSSGIPGITHVALVGTGFPNGVINPQNVTINFAPVQAGSGPSASSNPISANKIEDRTWRFVFVIPTSIAVASPTNYLVQVSGSYSDGRAFSSGNSASLTVLPIPSITSVSPNSGQAGQNLSVTITGVFTHFVQRKTRATFGAGISVGGAAKGAFGLVTVISATSATAQLAIDASAASGPRTVTVHTSPPEDSRYTEQVSLSNGFTVVGQNPPPVANPGGPYSGNVGQTVSFDGSKSSGPAGQTLTYAWNFGDGATGTGVAPTHSYSAAGTFQVSLTVTDTSAGTNTATTTATIVALPVANAGGPYTGNVGQTIAFDGSKSSGPTGQTLSYAWNFGDGATGTGVAPTHSYSAAGTFQVSLTVTDTSAGTNTATTTATIVALPVANAGGPYTGNVSQTITFNGSASTAPTGQTLTYAWNFGDNSTGTGAAPTHAYTSAGTFQVSLTVTDTSGGTNSASTTATIAGQSAAPSISDFNPKSAPIGSLITVTGNNFTALNGAAPTVSLNQQGGGTLNAPLSAFGATSLSFVIPSGAATGPLVVTAGTQSATSASALTITTSSSFTLGVTPGTGNLIQGQSTTFAVTINSGNGFSGLATLAVTGVPNGVTATFKPNAVTVGQTSVLTLSAPANQAPSTSTLSLSASATIDGQSVTQSATASLQVTGVTTSFIGRTVVDDAQQTPIGGVTVKFLGKDSSGNTTGCAGQTTSDAGGNFSLTNLPAACIGPQLISYDGSTATSPVGKFAGVNLSYTLTSAQVTTSPVLIHLPRIDNAETVQVQQNASANQVFTFQTIPGLVVTVYAGTTFSLDDGSQPTPFPLIAIDVPVDRLPDLMPTSGMLTPFIVAFQPANAVSSQPVAVNFPNPLNIPPATTATFMTLDPTRGFMVPYGTGTVSKDGTQFIADPDPAHPGHGYGLIHFDWHGPSTVVPPPKKCPSGDCCGGIGRPIEPSSGIAVVEETDIALRGQRGPIFIKRTYRGRSAIAGPFGLGTTHNYSYRLDTAFPKTASVINLIMPGSDQYPFSIQSNGTFTNSTVPTLRGAVMTVQADGSVSLRWKDGSIYRFDPATFQLGSVLTSITDVNGNAIFLIHGNSLSPIQITQVIDSVGRQLTLNYDTLDRITSIVDSISRTVSYTYN